LRSHPIVEAGPLSIILLKLSVYSYGDQFVAFDSLCALSMLPLLLVTYEYLCSHTWPFPPTRPSRNLKFLTFPNLHMCFEIFEPWDQHRLWFRIAYSYHMACWHNQLAPYHRCVGTGRPGSIYTNLEDGLAGVCFISLMSFPTNEFFTTFNLKLKLDQR
jgi:hypothetical protein